MSLSEQETKAIKHLQGRIAANNKARTAACEAEIAAALKRHNCKLNPIFMFDGDGPHAPVIQIEALPEKAE